MRQIITKTVALIASIAPDVRARMDQGPTQSADMLAVWDSALSHLDDETITLALQRLIRSHGERNCTPAHLIRYAQEIIDESTAMPEEAEIIADILEGRARFPYHATSVDFGGWEPKLGQITHHAAKLLGGWDRIDREDFHEPSARKTIREALPAMRRMFAGDARRPAIQSTNHRQAISERSGER